MEVYDEMAEFYDLIYSDEMDLEFYLREARNARGPVLEVACGTGRILLRLIRDGIDAMGVDLSERMLDKLQEKARSLGIEAKTVRADMAEFSIPRRFNLIILPYRSFLHLKDDALRKKALANFREHLAPGGRLILHTYNPSKEEAGMQGGYHKFDYEELTAPDGRKYSLEWFLHYEPAGRKGHYRISMIIDNREAREFRMDLGYVLPREMEALLKGSGYRNVKAYCGFRYYPLNDECKEVLWIAER
ncbi:class I SAM-dependent methyltransferase [Candidatus Micrarchaeota archaeon]|nr:class I SAM-dependent methyltransferase [Candidatus Micrarchaeota archaeon]